MPTPPPRSPRLMHAIVIASALLVVAGLLAFWWAAERAKTTPRSAADHTITVTIKNKVCEPNDITVPAGRTTFTIVNQSDRALEWEILDGVMVVEERENIAPGFSQTMTVKLKPGQFEITCGLLSNPRGALRVTPSASSVAEAARPSLVQYVGALAEYKVYLVLGSNALEDAAQQFTEAIAADDVHKAESLLGPARVAYARIEPMAARFADLDTRLNAQARYFEQREADPAFKGFYRLAQGLRAQSNLDTLAPIAQQLQDDVATLKSRLRTLDIPPAQLADSAARLLLRKADELSVESAGHPNELEVLQGSLDGTEKIADLLEPLLSKAAPPLQLSITEHFAAVDGALDPYRSGSAFKPGPLDEAQRKALADPVRALANELVKINTALSLE